MENPTNPSGKGQNAAVPANVPQNSGQANKAAPRKNSPSHRDSEVKSSAKTAQSANQSGGKPPVGNKNVPSAKAEPVEKKKGSFGTPYGFGRKLVLGICVFVGLLTLIYGLYTFLSEPWSSPARVEVSNVTSRSATVSWVTEKPTKGIAVYCDSEGTLPLLKARFGKQFGYDDRDVVNARLEAAQAEAENLAAEDSDSVSYGSVNEDVVLESFGEYYVHHVTLRNLEPETTYYFKVGNGVRFAKPDGSSDTVSVTTLPELEELPVPSPAYGIVKVWGDEEKPLDDGVVYMTLKLAGQESLPVSSALSDNGSWYIDLNNVRNENGGLFLSGVGTDDLATVEENLTVEGAKYGRYSKTITTENDAPADVIRVADPELDRNQPDVQFEGNSVSGVSSSLLVSYVYAADCGGGEKVNCSECKGGSSRPECEKGCNYDANGNMTGCGFMAYCQDRHCSGGDPDDCECGCNDGPWDCPSGQHCDNHKCKDDEEPTEEPPPSTTPGYSGCTDGYGPECCDQEGGNCIDLNNKECSVSVQHNKCPGGQNIKCCKGTVSNKGTSGDPAEGSVCEQEGGECIDLNSKSCSIAVEHYKCPGGQNIKCCKGTVSSGGGEGSVCDQEGGQCFDRETHDCSGTVETQKCPGGTNIVCCKGGAVTPKAGTGCDAASNGEKSYAGCSTECIDPDGCYCKTSKKGEYCNVNSKYANCGSFCPGYVGQESVSGACQGTEDSAGVTCSSDPNVYGFCHPNGRAERCTSSEKGNCTWDIATECAPLLTCSGEDVDSDTGDACNQESLGSCHSVKHLRCRIGITTGKCTWGEANDCPKDKAAQKCWGSVDYKSQICDASSFGSCHNTEHRECGRLANGQCSWEHNDSCPTTGAEWDCQGSDLESGETCNNDSFGKCHSSENLICDRVTEDGNCEWQWNPSCPADGGQEDEYCDGTDTENEQNCSNSNYGQCHSDREKRCGRDWRGNCEWINDSACPRADVDHCYGSDTEDGVTCNDGNFGTCHPNKESRCERNQEGRCTWKMDGFCEQGSSTKRFDLLSYFQSLGQMPSILSAATPAYAAEGEEETILLSPKEGLYVFEEPGTFSITMDGETYFFVISQPGAWRLFIDANGNGVYDEGDMLLGDDVQEISVKKETGSYEYSLKAGFNFVSFPYALTGSGEGMATQVLEDLNSRYDDSIYSIAKYDSGWVVVGNREGTTYVSADFQIVPGKGYLVRAKRDVVVSLTGKEVVDPVGSYVQEGWNLIGVHGSTQQYTASSLIDGISSTPSITADNVTQWDVTRSRYDGLQKEEDEAGEMNEYGFDFPIEDKISYFVRVTKGRGTWTPE